MMPGFPKRKRAPSSPAQPRAPADVTGEALNEHLAPPGWRPSPPPPRVITVTPEPTRRRELFTLDFWERAITQAVHASAAGALGPLAAHKAELLGSLPWYAILSSSLIGAGISLLGSLSTLTLPARAPATLFYEPPEEREALEAVREQFRAQRALERPQPRLGNHRPVKGDT